MSRDYLGPIMDAKAELEEMNENINGHSFTGRVARAYKNCVLFFSIGAVVMGLVCMFAFMATDVAILCFVLGGAGALCLPTLYSYRVNVNRETITESFSILFLIKISKTVNWSDIKYRKHVVGQNEALYLYNKDKKRVMGFDKGTIGYSRILKMATRSSIKKIE
ncbi:MAG: hypothetical protein E7592_07575 [Ruminococcaceae bacterium]|nr:hypothetical protein [Oscillospiraceae bacterium]